MKNSEFFRELVITLVPGLVHCVPGMALLMPSCPDCPSLANKDGRSGTDIAPIITKRMRVHRSYVKNGRGECVLSILRRGVLSYGLLQQRNVGISVLP